jgi:hypothetical protein
MLPGEATARAKRLCVKIIRLLDQQGVLKPGAVDSVIEAFREQTGRVFPERSRECRAGSHTSHESA